MQPDPMTPLLSLTLSPASEPDRQRLERGIRTLTADDPQLHIALDPVTGSCVIGGMGELHLEIAVDRLKREFGVSGSLSRPQVVYKEARFALMTFLLEPVMRVQILVQREYLDGVVADLSGRRGRIRSLDERDGMWVLTAQVPLQGMFGYGVALRERTQGRGTFTMQFDWYEPVD